MSPLARAVDQPFIDPTDHLSGLYDAMRETVRLLVERGAEVDSEDEAGRTALFEAEAVALPILLEHGASLDHTDAAGVTAYLWNLAHGKRDVASQLHALGASRDGEREMQLAEAAVEGDRDRVRALLEAGADPNRNPRRSPKSGHR